MKITAITQQVRDKDKVNILVDGKFFCSLYISQVVELGLKSNAEYTDNDLDKIKQASEFGKLYYLALSYCLMRQRSVRELKDYLFRKTMSTRKKDGTIKPGASKDFTDQVFNKLFDKGYVNDETFAKNWIEMKSDRSGISRRQLVGQLAKKGVDQELISKIMQESDHNEIEELKRIIAKKRPKYSDDKKMIAYLLRLGFNYHDIKNELNCDLDESIFD